MTVLAHITTVIITAKAERAPPINPMIVLVLLVVLPLVLLVLVAAGIDGSVPKI